MNSSDNEMSYAAISACILALALGDLFCYVPMLLKLLTKKVAWMHTDVTSDIPGNPHAFDDSIISLFRTLPELNNFNVVWTSLPLSEPLLLKGSLPPARINSLSIYAPDKVPNSIDLTKASVSSGGDIEIKIQNSTEDCSSNLLSTNDWNRGFLVMRNYLVPPGTRVVTPAIVKARDGTVVREAQVLTAGGPSTAHAMLGSMAVKIKKLMVVNSVFMLLCKYWLHLKAKLVIIMILSAGCIAVLLYRLLYVAGGRSLKKLSSLFCAQTNNIYPIALEKGAEVSQPSTMHRYWMMQLDIPLDCAMHVKGKIDPANQKYWSVIVYDEYGVPLPQFVYDENANKKACPHSKGAYDFDVCITLDPKQASICGDHFMTIIDISRRPEMRRGYVLFRLVHPEGDIASVEKYSTPQAVLRPIYGEGKLYKKLK